MRVAVAGFVLVAVSLAAVGAVHTPKSGLLPLPTTTGSSSSGPAAASSIPTLPTAPMVRSPTAIPVAAPVQVPVRAVQALPAATPAALPAPPAPAHTCANPNALGIARTVEIDTTGGPGFGFEHFKELDFLREHEVVLTFDDGPWPGNTPAVLAALASHCIKATFFPIGKHAMWHPEILREVAEQGHTIGSHTWSHADLSKKTPEEGKDEIEKGISAVRFALGAPESPFMRFPALRHPPEMVTYLGERNIAIFSTDIDSFDFKLRKPDKVVQSVMTKLKKRGKGIILLHDFQHATALALPELLNQLKANGYKIVHMKAKAPVQTIASYDELILKEQKVPTVSTRPVSDVVKTINE